VLIRSVEAYLGCFFHCLNMLDALQCMRHLVHGDQQPNSTTCTNTHFPLPRTLFSSSSNLQLGSHLDMSTHTFVQRRLLAQKLLERSVTARAVMEALDGPEANREAAIVVLLHCCRLNAQMSQLLLKAGLVRKLLALVNVPKLSSVDKACP
jgi:hypothetical protein